MALDISEQLKTTFTGLFSSIKTDRLEDLALAAVIALIGFFIARLLSNAFIQTIGIRFNAHQRLVWRRGIFYFIFMLFLITSLREAGFKLSVFLGAAGILTVAFGFASQTSASNLISGLFLIGEGSFEIGDMIQMTLIRGYVIEGEVISIDLLSIKLRTVDNILIRVPNELLIRTPVQNLSRFPIRRIPITLAIAFSEDMSKVRQVLLNLAADYALVLDEPRPRVTVTAFRESTIELMFAVWTRRDNFLTVRDEIQEMIKDDFIKNNIEIPVPKIDLHQNMAEMELHDALANSGLSVQQPNVNSTLTKR
jgi:small-conductance mechanosensitive channel